jgi:protein-L-isoaspartate(D-aspartate) O-methyltransferase
VRGPTDERRAARLELAQRLNREHGPFDPSHLDAIIAVDRARFVRPGDEERSVDDVPLPLDDEGLSTISAPHAYLLSFRLLDLGPGDVVVELGTGTGYGAALAAHIVGRRGRVVTFEIAPLLAVSARELLAPLANVVVHEADAMSSVEHWGQARRVVCTFAVEQIPDRWIDALPRGGVLVAPVGPLDRDQRLVRVVSLEAGPRASDHGAVRYVPRRQPTRGPFGGSGA